MFVFQDFLAMHDFQDYRAFSLHFPFLGWFLIIIVRVGSSFSTCIAYLKDYCALPL